jgi:hypothetical protein
MVQKVIPKERKLVIQTNNGLRGKAEINLELPAKYTLTRDGKAVERSELKKGVWVRVIPENRDGKLIASSIELVEEEPGPVEQLRQVLKIADLILQMAQKR